MKCLCGTPKSNCTGSKIFTNSGLGGYTIAHSSSKEAFRCFKKYLISLGYEPIGIRELRAPDGSGIKVLSKQSHFGMPLRKGKSEVQNRYQPRGRAAAGGFIC